MSFPSIIKTRRYVADLTVGTIFMWDRRVYEKLSDVPGGVMANQPLRIMLGLDPRRSFIGATAGVRVFNNLGE